MPILFTTPGIIFQAFPSPFTDWFSPLVFISLQEVGTNEVYNEFPRQKKKNGRAV